MSRLQPKSARSYDRIFSQLFSTPWLITEEWMMTIIEIVKHHGEDYDIDAVAKRKAARLEQTERARIYGSTAVVPISGPIFPKSNLMTEFSGATSIESVARDLTSAVENEEVSKIILDIDSPGGHVTGVNEMANMIREYSDKKPITAYVSGTAASAAYWLGSAANEMVLDRTSRVGSIGVVTVFPKNSGDTVEIVNTASPNKRVDVETDEGKKVVVEQMDALADVFVSSVAEFRGVTEKQVLKDFGKGGILIGEHAIKAGMADRLGSFEQLLKENGGTSMPEKGQKALTLEELKADHPELWEAISNEGYAQAEGEASAVIAKKDEEIETLKSTIETMEKENASLNDRVVSLEKKDAIRDEQEMKRTADAIITASLNASSLTPRQHAKVRKQFNHEKFIEDGVLNTQAFSEHVEAEIGDWEETIAESSDSPVLGFGSNSEDKVDPKDETSKSDDEIVAKLIKLGQ